MVMSDGVYDNLDPQFKGILPSELGNAAQSWDEISAEDAQKLKSQYCISMLEDIINNKCREMSEQRAMAKSAEAFSAPELPTAKDLTGMLLLVMLMLVYM